MEWQWAEPEMGEQQAEDLLGGAREGAIRRAAESLTHTREIEGILLVDRSVRVLGWSAD